MAIRIKNWSKFQHFKDRKPPWIKLYRDLLDDRSWYELSDSAAKLLVSLWLLASEDKNSNGELPPINEIAFRLRLDIRSIKSNISKLSTWLEQDDIKPISDISAISSGYQETRLETETETETYQPETEKEGLPDWIPKESWNGFCEMRKKSNSAFTERAKLLLIGKLLDLKNSGQEISKVLDQSTENGWKSVYPLKTNGGSHGKFNAVQYVAKKFTEEMDAGSAPQAFDDLHGEVHKVLPR